MNVANGFGFVTFLTNLANSMYQLLQPSSAAGILLLFEEE